MIYCHILLDVLHYLDVTPYFLSLLQDYLLYVGVSSDHLSALLWLLLFQRPVDGATVSTYLLGCPHYTHSYALPHQQCKQTLIANVLTNYTLDTLIWIFLKLVFYRFVRRKKKMCIQLLIYEIPLYILSHKNAQQLQPCTSDDTGQTEVLLHHEVWVKQSILCPQSHQNHSIFAYLQNVSVLRPTAIHWFMHI